MATLPDSFVGALQPGDSWESALKPSMGGSMDFLPPLSLTGGAAAPSGAVGGANKATVFSIAGGGGALWYSMAAAILGVVWILHKKK